MTPEDRRLAEAAMDEARLVAASLRMAAEAGVSLSVDTTGQVADIIDNLCIIASESLKAASD